MSKYLHNIRIKDKKSLASAIQLNHKDKEDFVDVVKKETNGAGVHHALDPVGGKHLKKSFKSLRSGGKLYAFGGSSFVRGPKIFKLTALWRLLRSPKDNSLNSENLFKFTEINEPSSSDINSANESTEFSK